MYPVRCEFFHFQDGPWRNQVRENPFDPHSHPPTSLLISGGPIRYVLTTWPRQFPGGEIGAVYQLDPTSTIAS